MKSLLSTPDLMALGNKIPIPKLEEVYLQGRSGRGRDELLKSQFTFAHVDFSRKAVRSW